MFKTKSEPKTAREQPFEVQLRNIMEENKRLKAQISGKAPVTSVTPPSSEDDEEEDTEIKEILAQTPAEYLDKTTQEVKRPRTKLGNMTEGEKSGRHRDQMKTWRDTNPDYSKTYRQKYYEANREKILEKRRAKRAEEKRQLGELALMRNSIL